jgi:hypothetical protein
MTIRGLFFRMTIAAPVCLVAKHQPEVSVDPFNWTSFVFAYSLIVWLGLEILIRVKG